MSNPTTPFSWQMPTATDLVTDLPADFEVFGQAVATSMADLLGGTTGQILSKTTNADMDFTWINNDQGDITGVTAGTGISGGGTSGTVTVTNSMATAIDAKGDLIGGTGADTFARLAVGTNGQVLTADSAEATGLKWATPGGGGKVLQVVSTTYSTAKTIASTTLTDTDLTLSITPTSATSKILVLLTQNYWLSSSSSTNSGFSMVLVRGATTVFDMNQNGYNTRYIQTGNATSVDDISYFSMQYLDSPATTSSTTYKTQAKVYSTAASRQVIMNSNSSPATMILMEIGA